MIDLKKLGYEKEKYGKTEQGIPARVTAVHRERYEVISAQGESFARCRASAYRNCRAADYPTVGDFVELLPAENSDGWILRTLPRQTVFTRTNLHGHAAKFVKNIDEQAVAANFDWVWIVQSLNHNFSLSRLERYLALTRSSGARAMVVLSKRDLDADWRQKAESVRAFCGEVPVCAVSAATGEGMEQLRPMLRPGVTLAMLGSSGVGKSSLLNALCGEEVMETGAIRESDSKGRHTTTYRRLVQLPGGALLIDTPGMRELGVIGEAQQEIDERFADVRALAAQCRFANCMHEKEPDCAVRAAIERGELDPRRLKLYRDMTREADFARSHTAKKK